MAMKIAQLKDIVDPIDRTDAKHGNCIYLNHSSGYSVPVYVDNDKRTAWIGNKSNTGMSNAVKMEVWKFVIALGFKPIYEEISYV